MAIDQLSQSGWLERGVGGISLSSPSLPVWNTIPEQFCLILLHIQCRSRVVADLGGVGGGGIAMLGWVHAPP